MRPGSARLARSTATSFPPLLLSPSCVRRRRHLGGHDRIWREPDPRAFVEERELHLQILGQVAATRNGCRRRPIGTPCRCRTGRPMLPSGSARGDAGMAQGQRGGAEGDRRRGIRVADAVVALDGHGAFGEGGVGDDQEPGVHVGVRVDEQEGVVAIIAQRADPGPTAAPVPCPGGAGRHAHGPRTRTRAPPPRSRPCSCPPRRARPPARRDTPAWPGSAACGRSSRASLCAGTRTANRRRGTPSTAVRDHAGPTALVAAAVTTDR